MLVRSIFDYAILLKHQFKYLCHVAAIEKCTGKSKHVTIEDAFEVKDEAEMAEAAERLDDLYGSRQAELEKLFASVKDDMPATGPEVEVVPEAIEEPQIAEAAEADSEWARAEREAAKLLERSENLLDDMHDEDKEEAVDIHKRIESAIEARDEQALNDASQALKELLFFIEGK